MRGLYSNGNIVFNEKVIGILESDYSVFIITSHYMVSANIYTLGWTTTLNKDLDLTHAGPGHYFVLDNTLSFTCVKKILTTTNEYVLCFSISNGQTLIYFISSKLYDYDLYGKNIIGNKKINSFLQVSIPVSEKEFSYENSYPRDEFYPLKYDRMTNRT
jgi:hypothetical protein